MVKADTQAAMRQLLKTLRKQYNESAERFGSRLADITGARPYTRSYISLMESGAVGISGTISQALQTLAKKQIMVRPAPGVQVSPGTDVLISERPCAKCQRPFVGVPAARYCGRCRKPRTVRAGLKPAPTTSHPLEKRNANK